MQRNSPNIPAPLQDRLEIIRIAGYTDLEKLSIAQRYLVPKQKEHNGLEKVNVTFSRKAPIVAGMLLSTSMIACNYVDSSTLVVAIMAFAFFGKGLGALGWAVVSDTSPKEIAGLSGALFNTFGNVAAITTPIVIGYIVAGTGSFNATLVFVAANALAAVVSYLFVVGEIRRVVLVRM